MVANFPLKLFTSSCDRCHKQITNIHFQQQMSVIVTTHKGSTVSQPFKPTAAEKGTIVFIQL